MTTLLSLMLHPLAQALGWTLLHFLWQGAALGLLAWLALVLLRGATARARYGLACAFLLLMVATPIATFLILQPATPLPTSPLTLHADANKDRGTDHERADARCRTQRLEPHRRLLPSRPSGRSWAEYTRRPDPAREIVPSCSSSFRDEVVPAPGRIDRRYTANRP